VRDPQRLRFERAERTVFSWNSVALHPKEANAALADIVKTRWFKKRFPLIAANGVIVETNDSGRIKVNRCRATTLKCQGEIFQTLHLYRVRRTRLALLHALAHAAIGCGTHDREFASVYVLLVNRFMGRPAALELVAALEREGVRWKRKRRISPEKLAALRARFALVRKSFKGKEVSS
jgi:hypothetical protein